MRSPTVLAAAYQFDVFAGAPIQAQRATMAAVLRRARAYARAHGYARAGYASAGVYCRRVACKAGAAGYGLGWAYCYNAASQQRYLVGA